MIIGMLLFARVVIVVFGVLAAFLIYIGLKDSPWFSKVVDKTIEEKDLEVAPTTDVINRIAKAEEALSDRVKEQEKEVKKIVTDNKNINQYLKSRNSSGDADTEDKEEGPMK